MKETKMDTDKVVIITSVFPVGIDATAGMFVEKLAKFLNISHDVQILLTANQFSFFK